MYDFAAAELETKKILLDIFKEKQQNSAQSGTLPSFYKKVLTLLSEKGFLHLSSSEYLLL